MFWNGVVTGMAATHQWHKLIRQVPVLARTVCFVVAVGAAKRGTVVWRNVAALLPTFAAASLGFA